jgi:hypothetical protein
MARRAGARRELKKKKGGALRRGAPLKAARGSGRGRRKWWAVTTVGTAGEAVGVDKAAATTVRTRSAHPGASVRTVGLIGGPHTVLIFFQFIQSRLNFKNSKWVSYITPKISNFCMRLSWDIMNNFINCANIQFPI